jgi:hypothetical protein
MSQINIDDYSAKYLSNKKVEWLIEHGKIRENVYFRGAIGDRYTIYVATKRNKNVVDFHTVHNSYDYGTTKGNYIASIKDYVLSTHSARTAYWHSSTGYMVKQLMRQGVEPKDFNKQWRIRFCRSEYFMKLWNQVEFTPWIGMKIDLKTGNLVNKPTKHSANHYKAAKARDKQLRKSNRLANKNNNEANTRYLAADGNYALLPIDDVFKLRNTDRRNDIMNFHGLENIIATLETKVEDEDTIDGRFYRLINVNIPDLASGQERNDWGLYLEMINPSTGESHFEGIANVVGKGMTGGWSNDSIEEATVKAALSWRDGDGIISSGDTWRAKSTSVNYVKPIILT